MYGPLETRSRPYPPGVVKHLATSRGIGPAAGRLSRYRKSGVGVVRWKVMVRALGVVIPEIVFALPDAKASMPAMVE